MRRDSRLSVALHALLHMADAELLTRAARTWLATGTRVTLSVVPAGRPELALAGSEPISVT